MLNDTTGVPSAKSWNEEGSSVGQMAHNFFNKLQERGRKCNLWNKRRLKATLTTSSVWAWIRNQFREI